MLHKHTNSYTLSDIIYIFFLDIFPKTKAGGGEWREQLCNNPFSSLVASTNLISSFSSTKRHDLLNKIRGRNNWNLDFPMLFYFLLPRCLTEYTAFRRKLSKKCKCKPPIKKCEVKFVSVRNPVARKRKESRIKVTNYSINI